MSECKRIPAAVVAAASASLLAGAFLFQFMGYPPCEMCIWQRWAHAGAIGLSLLSMRANGCLQILICFLGIASLLTSGAIGAYHAGVEWKFWEGMTTCSSLRGAGSGDVLLDILRAPMIRCDEAAWRLFGISMAGYNAIFSMAAALVASHLALSSRIRAISDRSEK